MKQYFFKSVGVMALVLIATAGFSQSDRNEDKVDENKQIIIQQKNEKNSKVTVEIKNGEVKVNGKPLSEFKDDDITVRIETEGGGARAYVRSPFRSGANAITLRGGDNVLFDSNRPVLGVMTENHEDGAKITSVTKGSGAEKAGLKSGDIINRINDIKVENAQDLTEAVAKFKPEEKVSVRIKRDNKTETVTATLGKRSAGATNLFPGEFNVDNFRYHFDDLNGVTAYGLNQGRLGIKAQDTEDEKGVKVLSVDADSHAAKSGIKEGDIIHQFDGEEVNSATELAAAARQARDKNNIKLRISRDGKSQDMEIKIPKKLRTANL